MYIFLLSLLLFIFSCDSSGNALECATDLYDCAGECDGDAVEDCAGECNGDAIYDCEGECINDLNLVCLFH